MGLYMKRPGTLPSPGHRRVLRKEATTSYIKTRDLQTTYALCFKSQSNRLDLRDVY